MVKRPGMVTGGSFYRAYSAGDIMPHHYGACGICQEFDDAVCITIPATVVYETMVADTGRIKLHILWAVTRASGPSN